MSVWMKQPVSWTVKEQFPGHVSAEFLCPDLRVSCRWASWVLAAADEAKQWGNRVEKTERRSSIGHRLFTVCGRLAAVGGAERKKKRVDTKLRTRRENWTSRGLRTGSARRLPALSWQHEQKTPGGNLLWWRHCYSNTIQALVVVYTQQTRTLKLQPNTSKPYIPFPGDIPASSCCDPRAGERHNDYTTVVE